MAGRCHRTYSRKKASAPPISQFDRLISETGKGTHPVASKTAGHVGKWGITSFTSLRSINGSYGKEEPLKRNSSSFSDEPDPFSFDTDKTDDKKASATKRRKFFKSRDAERASSETGLNSINEQPDGGPAEFLLKAPKLNNAYSLPSSKDSTSLSKPVKETKDASKPSCGIKLKIFKSRNSDTYSSDTYSSTIQLPSDDSSNSSNGNCAPLVLDEMAPDRNVIPLCVAATVSVQSPIFIAPSPTSREIATEDSLSPGLPSTVSSFEFGEINDNKADLSGNTSIACSIDNKSLNNFSDYSDNLIVGDFKQVKSCVDDYKNANHCVDDYKNVNHYVDDYKNVNHCVDDYKNANHCVDDYKNANHCVDDYKNANHCVDDFKHSLKECDDGPFHGFPSVKEVKSVRSSFLTENDTLSKINNSTDTPSKSEVSKETLKLFCTDFDEDEIIDRTSIDYLSSEPQVETFQEQTLSRADTLDLDELPPSQSSLLPKVIKPSETDSNTNNNSIAKKKSIFKSRQKEGDAKKRATYNHKWHGHEDKEAISKKEALQKSSSMSLVDGGNTDPFGFGTPTLTKTQTWPSGQYSEDMGMDLLDDANSVVSVKCPRQVKKFYTVIKNVKKTHQLQESGEFQEFNDDVDYFLDALKDTNSSAMRCLASLNLAQKCMVPAFRMHLRAHATVTKFFRSLLDSPSHPYLAECAAMVMFALSQDRLNMDLDRCSLELMLNLLDTDSSLKDSNSQLPEGATADHASKIKILCKELQLQGHAKHLKLDDINAGTLAMETLLSLTSKRAGEWFKEELRMLGGVDHLVRTVTSNFSNLNMEKHLWTPTLLEKLSKIDRCLKVLENVTHQNESNQEHLLQISEGQFAKTLMQLFWMCHREVPLNPETSSENVVASKSIITMLITTIKVLINLTHGSRKEALGSKLLGKDEEIYSLTVNCLLLMPVHLNHDTKFEIQVLSCCLLLNLVEKSEENRERLMGLISPLSLDDACEIFVKDGKQKSAMASLVDLFYSCEESAREQEAHTDHIIEKDLDHQEEDEKKDEDIEDTVARLLQKAGRHMEDTLIAAYTALLAGYCLLNNKEFEGEIRAMQPEGHFKTMVSVLKKFLHFMNLTATTSLLRSLKPTEQVVKYMESLDKKPEEEIKEKLEKKETEVEDEDLAFDAFGF